jgi:hypothetical protein
VVALGAERARVHEIGWGVDVNLFTGSGGGALAEQLGSGAPTVVSTRGHKPIYNWTSWWRRCPRCYSRCRTRRSCSWGTAR